MRSIVALRSNAPLGSLVVSIKATMRASQRHLCKLVASSTPPQSARVSIVSRHIGSLLAVGAALGNGGTLAYIAEIAGGGLVLSIGEGVKR